MSFSYKPLWKLFIDLDLTKKELMQLTGISKSTINKMGRGEQVSMDIISRLCNHFGCAIEDIVCYTHTEVKKNG